MSAGGWAVLAVVIGVVIVALAVGIPYFLTHRSMHGPHDLSEGRRYLRFKQGRHGTAAGPTEPVAEPTERQP